MLSVTCTGVKILRFGVMSTLSCVPLLSMTVAHLDPEPSLHKTCRMRIAKTNIFNYLLCTRYILQHVSYAWLVIRTKQIPQPYSRRISLLPACPLASGAPSHPSTYNMLALQYHRTRAAILHCLLSSKFELSLHRRSGYYGPDANTRI